MNENPRTRLQPETPEPGPDRALNAHVRDALWGAIQSGELVPGDKLAEVEWAQRLGVSRAPVREAFRALEQAGLLEMVRNRGVFVRTVSAQEADELRAVRTLVEAHACRLLAERLDAGCAAELHRMLDAMSDALALDDRPRYRQLDRTFHDLIVASAGNGTLHGIYRDMIDQLHLSNPVGDGGDRQDGVPRTAPHSPAIDARVDGPDSASRDTHIDVPIGTMRSALAEHRALVTALASRDAEGAARIMQRHIDPVLNRST